MKTEYGKSVKSIALSSLYALSIITSATVYAETDDEIYNETYDEAYEATPSVDIKAGFAIDMGFGVTAQFNDNINLMVGNDGVAADYIFKQGSFSSELPFTWYVAGGAFAGWNDGFGLRIPFGIDLDFAPKWDAYLQLSPELNLNNDVNFSVDAGIGIRYAF